MFSKAQIALLVVAAVASVEGFAPVAQPRTTTQLEAFSFPNFGGNKGAATKGVAKKAAPKKIGVKNVSKKPTFGAKSDFVVPKKPEKKGTKLTIYERQCHIN